MSFSDDIKSYCANYAESALKSASVNIKLNCGFEGSRWINQGVHYKWCLNTPLSISKKETEEREKKIKKCALSSKNKIYTINIKNKTFKYKKHHLSKYSAKYFFPYIKQTINLLKFYNDERTCSNNQVAIDYSNGVLTIKLFNSHNSLDRKSTFEEKYNFVCFNTGSYSDTEFNSTLIFKLKNNKYCLSSMYDKYSTSNAYFEAIDESKSSQYDFIANKVKVTMYTSYKEGGYSDYTKKIKPHGCISINDGLMIRDYEKLIY